MLFGGSSNFSDKCYMVELRDGALTSTEMEQAKLQVHDRFFYNLPFFVDRIPSKGILPTSRQRYLIMPGREALHAFDVKEERWLFSEVRLGYM